MKIELKEISIRNIAENYIDNAEEGVIGYNGRLNIRPKYQREFVYDEAKRNAVIDTIRKNFPLNVMYWVKNDNDQYEILDGQQRTISFCQFVTNCFSVDVNGYPKAFNNMTLDEKNQILDYKVMVYFCEGTEDEKLAWFRIINIAGEKLTEQELRNATYTGTWLSSAKKDFSKTGCAAYQLAKDYVKGSPIRQEMLETAISWISKGQIETYMADHQHDANANALWIYFRNVIEWVQRTFPKYRKEMKGINWSELYDKYKDEVFDTQKLEDEISSLMMDDDVTNKKGIYPFVLTRQQKYLSIRAFTDNMKREAFERQKGICSKCNQKFELKEMEADHITPWHLGGKTISSNCQMLCKECNRRKSGK